MNSGPIQGKLTGSLASIISLLVVLSWPRASGADHPTNYQSGTVIAEKWTQPPPRPSAAPRNVVLWDTSTAVSEKFNPEDRSGWKPVPNDLLLLESDPPKASSDPGYYGREYAFQGDAVVETPALLAVFSSRNGRVRLYSKNSPSSDEVVDLSPIPSASISHIEILRNTDDEIALEVAFSPSASATNIAIFSFDKTGIVEVKPTSMPRIGLSGPFAYGVAPAFIGDDLIYGGAASPATNVAAVPAENLFLALAPGESRELVMTWPPGRQRLNLQFAQNQGGPAIERVEFDTDGRSFYLAGLSAPGIWHKEVLTSDFLEKDVTIHWKAPFPAKWKTQLYEEELKTTYAFRESQGNVWRGVAGSYEYPVWFEGDNALYHLGKKVQPKGESLIYFLEGRGTPLSILTPADMLKQTLGRQASDPILDLAGRKLRTHHRRGAVGVRRACTCGCTEVIQAMFEAGEEDGRKQEIQGALDDMIYFVHCHVERINEDRQFAAGLLKIFDEKKRSHPDLQPYLDNLEGIVQQIPQEYEVQKENMKDFEYADELSRKTMALTDGKDPGHLKAYMELLKAWRAMGGAQDYVLAKCHVITRNLYLQAGYGCATSPSTLPLAEEIRARCRQTLRNPDGYEVWADY